MTTEAPVFRRDDLAQFFGSNQRLMRAFEDQATVVQEASGAATSAAAATDALNDATVIVLSANAAFNNERVLRLETGLELDDSDPGYLTIRLKDVARSADYAVTLVPPGDATLFLPLTGTLATRANAETLSLKTIDAPKITGLGNYANDAAAAAGGVPVTGVYRNGSVLMFRVV